MVLSEETRHMIADELIADLHGRTDGRRANILVSECPVCHKKGYKFGIYIGPDKANKTFGSSHCFKCGVSFKGIEGTLKLLGREDLIPTQTADLGGKLLTGISLYDDELDDDLEEVEMPDGYKRCYSDKYLKSRGFTERDYEFFECGTNRAMDFRLKDYIIFPIIDNEKKVGYVSRYKYSKEYIDEYNETHRRKIRRYVNSTENEFGKLLYNYDSIIKYKTEVVILVEGVFDAIALTRKMELYDNERVAVVCTFGKKISQVQAYKLQVKAVPMVVVAYDADATESTGNVAITLDQYFDTYIADLSGCGGKDFDEMSELSIYEVFSKHLKTVREFNI